MKRLAAFGTALLLLGALGGCGEDAGPKGGARHDMAARRMSMNNLRNLSILLAERHMTKRAFPPFDGKAFVLSLAAYRMVDARNPSNLSVFFSPGDELLSLSRVDPDSYEAVTLQALKAGEYDPDLTSYVGRRNADREYLMTPHRVAADEPIFLDLSFPGYVLAGYASGRVRALTFAELGVTDDDLDPDGRPWVGEDATNEFFRPFSDQ